MNEKEIQQRLAERMPPEIDQGADPQAQPVDEADANVELVSHQPWDEVRRFLIDSSLASYGYNPRKFDDLTEEERDYMLDTLMDGAVLPNALEGVQYVFYVENISKTLLAQITRTRIGASFISVTSGDFDQRHTDYIVPTAVKKQGFEEEYKMWADTAYEAYAKMVDNGVPLEQAREILPCALRNYHILTINYRALENLWNQRRCEPSQPQPWVYIFDQIKEQLEEVHPPLGEKLTWECEQCDYPYVMPWVLNMFPCPHAEEGDKAHADSGNFAYEEDARELRAPEDYERYGEQ